MGMVRTMSAGWRERRPLVSALALSLGLAALLPAGCARPGSAVDAPAGAIVNGASEVSRSDDRAADRPDGLRADPVRPERPAPSLALTDQHGRPWSLDQSRGLVRLLFFGYTHCPDYCPQTLAVLGQVRRELGAESERLQVVMVSADPERDRPEVLAAYLGDHQPDAVGLTGEFEAVTAMAEAFGAEFHKDPIRQAGGAPGGDGDYTVTHTGRLYLVDPQGQIRGSYLGALAPEDVAHDVRVLLELSP